MGIDFQGRPSLDDVLQLSQLRAFVRDEVKDVLQSQGGKRKLFLESRLTGAMETVLGEHGDAFLKYVRQHADLYLCSDDLAEEARATTTSPAAAGASNSQEKWIYILRGSLPGLKNLAERIRLDIRARETQGSSRPGFFRKKPEIEVYFVPRKFCRSVLREAFQAGAISKLGEGGIGDAPVEVWGHRLTISSLELDLIPVEHDLITMQMGDFLKDTSLLADVTSLTHIARSLVKIQAFYGDFKAIRGKGRCADMVGQILRRLKLEASKLRSNASHPSHIDCLYVFDREIDPLTPVLTHFTYEGLMDEIFGLSNQVFSSQDISAEAQKDVYKTKNHQVFTAEADIVFKEVRSALKSELGADMHAVALSVQEKREERKDLKELRDIRKFMEKVPIIKETEQLLSVHLAIAQEMKKVFDTPEYLDLFENQKRLLGFVTEEHVNALEGGTMKYLDSCIFQGHALPKVLRLLCATSLTEGFTRKTYDDVRQKLVTAYGICALGMMENLERAGFLGVGKRGALSLPNTRALRSKGADVVDQLQFWKDKPDRHVERKHSRTDAARFYDGYKPPLVRLAESAILGGLSWNGMDAPLNELPGPTFGPPDLPPECVREDGSVVMLMFLGGITHGEIAALRLIGEMAKEHSNTRIVILTTEVINGDQMIERLAGHKVA
eukprot:TRINITY_DN21978_c0_g1_i1.p1 TRINITY_DN21978_c0_g1~~TRINITY_DN21978_c0_g1_i1.p1  ORF type:complete len:667 (+),score=240.53 TRINITY_DN21978_c0_g1_i1:118-2118(+)